MNSLQCINYSSTRRHRMHICCRFDSCCFWIIEYMYLVRRPERQLNLFTSTDCTGLYKCMLCKPVLFSERLLVLAWTSTCQDSHFQVNVEMCQLWEGLLSYTSAVDLVCGDTDSASTKLFRLSLQQGSILLVRPVITLKCYRPTGISPITINILPLVVPDSI